MRLLPLNYQPVSDVPWPTLGEMVRSGKRLVVMLENQTGGADAPWLINGFEFTQETPFTFPTADDFTCDPNRGSSGVRPNAVRTLTSLPSTSPRWAMSRKSSTH